MNRIQWSSAAPVWAAFAVLLIISQPVPVQADVIGRTESTLPLGEVMREQLDFNEAAGSDLLSTALNQFNFFFPAGMSSQVAGRSHLDALVAATLLLEEGMRRGPGTYRHARTLFDCYALMYVTGQNGGLARSFTLLLEQGEERASAEELDVIGVYIETLNGMQSYGRDSARALGQVLIHVRPEETDVAYILASIAEQEGDADEAARLFSEGLEGEMYPQRLLALAELTAVAEDDTSSEHIDTALSLAPGLGSQVSDVEERADLRQRLNSLTDRYERGRADEEQTLELAVLYRQSGRVNDAMHLFQELADWRHPSEEYLEEYAIAAMEANQPALMLALLADTGEAGELSPRLLQLRIISDSLGVVTSAATRPEGALRVVDYLETSAGERMAGDLAHFEETDPGRAQFVRVYLELVTALIELRRSGSLDDTWSAEIEDEVLSLLEAQPDNVSGHRFQLMLAIYSRELDRLDRALQQYADYCETHECTAEFRRTAITVLLQTAAREVDTEPLDLLDRRLDQWGPADQLHHLALGTAAMIRAAVERSSASERDSYYQNARDELAEGLSIRTAPGSEVWINQDDYAALYNNLAFLAMESRDWAAARLYLESARRYRSDDPVVLLNLAVALANGQNFSEAFITMSMGGAGAVMDPAMRFQLLRWTGHISGIAENDADAAQAYATALQLYEQADEWGAGIDDGYTAGGPVEWGLTFDNDEGLLVTLDLASPPMFFIPAPVGVLQMSNSVPP